MIDSQTIQKLRELLIEGVAERVGIRVMVFFRTKRNTLGKNCSSLENSLRFNNGTEAAEAMKYRTTTVFFEKCAMSSVLFFSLCLQLAEVFVFIALKI